MVTFGARCDGMSISYKHNNCKKNFQHWIICCWADRERAISIEELEGRAMDSIPEVV